jgi:ribosomal protein S17
METGTATAAVPARHQRQELTGVVTSAKMEKTIVVKVTRLVKHKLYTRVMLFQRNSMRTTKSARRGWATR